MQARHRAQRRGSYSHQEARRRGFGEQVGMDGGAVTRHRKTRLNGSGGVNKLITKGLIEGVALWSAGTELVWWQGSSILVPVSWSTRAVAAVATELPTR